MTPGRLHVVLVHSPLVGPATWAPVADALRAAGHAATVPALTPPLNAPRPWWRSAAAEVAAAVARSARPSAGDDAPAHRSASDAAPAADDDDDDAVRPNPAAGAGVARSTDDPLAPTLVLAGHSGAGLALPAVADALARAGHPVGATCFVDALLPADGARPADGAPPAFTALLADLAVDGLLPPWADWFGGEVMAAAVPDPATRVAVVGELVPVPTTYFDDPVPVPPGEPTGPCAYLSFTYDDELAEARRRGWPTAELAGGHLHTVVDPAAVAAALVDLVAAALGRVLGRAQMPAPAPARAQAPAGR